MATLVHVAPDAEARLDAVRASARVADARCECGASAWNGMLVVRFLVARAERLRAAAIMRCRPLRDLPRARRRASGRQLHGKDTAMNLTPREKDKLLIAMAAIVARRRLERGVKLNHPEAIALITDFVVEGARDGRTRRRADGGGRACRHRAIR